MKLSWLKTGDCLDIEVVNTALIDVWLPQLNSHNCFELLQAPTQIDSAVKQLIDSLGRVNTMLERLSIAPLANPNSDWYNQDNLNTLHRDWVKIQHRTKIVEFLSRLPNNLLDQFHDINNLIHDIEHSLVIKYSNASKTPWQIVNPFGPDVLKFGSWQIELDYQNLGRSTYEKWLNYDEDIDNEDTNNFTHIGGTVVFNIARPIYSGAPTNYLEWCRQHGVQPYGNKLPLGNFALDLGTLRTVFYRNVAVPNNTIVFEL